MVESSGEVTVDSLETFHKHVLKEAFKHSYELAEEIYKKMVKKKIIQIMKKN